MPTSADRREGEAPAEPFEMEMAWTGGSPGGIRLSGRLALPFIPSPGLPLWFVAL